MLNPAADAASIFVFKALSNGVKNPTLVEKAFAEPFDKKGIVPKQSRMCICNERVDTLHAALPKIVCSTMRSAHYDGDSHKSVG